MEIKKKLRDKDEEIEVSKKEIIKWVKLRRKERVVEVYVKENVGEMLQELERWVGKKEGEVDTIIERNFNARTGEEESGVGRKEKNV